MADFIIGAIMLVLPMGWFSIMGAFGVGAGNIFQGAFDGLNKPAGAVGEQAGKIGEGAANKAVDTVTSGVKVAGELL